jgi:hypothetical protein
VERPYYATRRTYALIIWPLYLKKFWILVAAVSGLHVRGCANDSVFTWHKNFHFTLPFGLEANFHITVRSGGQFYITVWSGAGFYITVRPGTGFHITVPEFFVSGEDRVICAKPNSNGMSIYESKSGPAPGPHAHISFVCTESCEHGPMHMHGSLAYIQFIFKL